MASPRRLQHYTLKSLYCQIHPSFPFIRHTLIHFSPPLHYFSHISTQIKPHLILHPSMDNPESQLAPQLGVKLISPQNTHNPSIEIIKEEFDDDIVVEVEELLGFDKKDGVLLSTSEMEDFVPKPFGMLHDLGPPPFLTKTYEMVENPEFDEIISWGENGFSFVVWDTHKFTTDLLPKNFKHSNFSSFVRQLNTYGFKKVHFDRWEFANVAFQRGKKQLLKSIKRKYHGGSKNSKFQNEIDIEKLKLDQGALKVEINDLKQQQLDSNQSLASMEERIKSLEWRQKELLLFIAKAMKRTPLFYQPLQKYRRKKALENKRVSKRRRLASSETIDGPFCQNLNQNVDLGPEEDIIDVQAEESPFLGSSLIGLGAQCLQEQSSSLTSETSSSDLSSGNYIMWEKLMEDEVICEDDEESIDVDQTNFVNELEDLIGKPPALGSFANVGEISLVQEGSRKTQM